MMDGIFQRIIQEGLSKKTLYNLKGYNYKMNKIDIISNIIIVIGSIMYVLNYKFDNGVLYMIFRIIM
jgi:hypothetical protein